MKILIVDDDAGMIAVLRKLLGQLDYADVDAAEEGTAALRRLKEERYALVISDWQMDPMDGLELLAAIRSDAALGEMPFILVTADVASGNEAKARQAGASGFLLKPFGRDALKARIEAATGRA